MKKHPANSLIEKAVRRKHHYFPFFLVFLIDQDLHGNKINHSLRILPGVKFLNELNTKVEES